MTIKTRAFLLLTCFCQFAFAQEKKVCFTYDDLPLVTYGISDTSAQKSMMDKLISSLRQNNIPAIGFVNESKLYSFGRRNAFQVDLLRSWIYAGLNIGNHTFSHPDYNSASFADFTQNITKGETITAEILKGRGEKLTYFRHPFLHVGQTKGKADSLQAFLIKRGYQVAPVSIDDEDYLFALAYKRSKDKNDTALINKIGRDYVAYMEKKLKYYEQQANRLFGRNIRQILLVHASALNADYTDKLALMYKQNGYRFVSMDEALKDEAYKTEITVYGKWGISWVDRWALSQGKKKEFFADDPVTPDYIVKLAE